MSMSKSPPEYLNAHHASSCSLEKRKTKDMHHIASPHHTASHLSSFGWVTPIVRKTPKTQTNVSSNYVACLKQYLKISPQKAPSNSWNSPSLVFTQAAHGVPSGPLSHAFQWVRSLSTSWGPPAYPGHTLLLYVEGLHGSTTDENISEEMHELHVIYKIIERNQT